MRDLIAICGLDCEKCEARIATLNNDDALRAKVAAEWSVLNQAEITPEMINCVGCRVEGPKTPFCASMCPIKKCARSKGYETCGECADLKTCNDICMITGSDPQVYENLKGD